MTHPTPREDEAPQQSAAVQRPPAVGKAVVGPPPAVARPPLPPPPPQQQQQYAGQSAPLPPPRPLPAPPPVPLVNPPTGGMVIGRDPTLSAPAVAVPPAPDSTTAARQAAQATAAAAAAATSAAASRAAARAVPDTGNQGPPGTVYESRRPPTGGGRRGLSGRLARLRIGSHMASRSALAELRLSVPGTGLILGADRQQRPVTVRFFRPEPTRVALVGGAWAGQLVAFRALALGARVAVITADPRTWHGFGERATGRGDRVAVFPTEQPLALAATAQQPVLVVYDLGLTGPAAPQSLGPWQTQLIVLRQLDQTGVPSIQDCNLVMLQRLGSAEAALAGGALRLPAPSTQFLQVMADDMIALVGDGADRYIWFAQTDVERQYAGAPRR